MKTADWIELTLVSACALRCDYCAQDLLANHYKKTGGDKRMSVNTLMDILHHVPADRVGIDFSGYADACLHPEFIYYFNTAVELGFTVSLFTTFERLKKTDYDILKTIPFETLSVHLPDSAEMIHLKWTDDYLAIMHALVDDPPKCQFHDRMVVKGPLHPDLAFLEPVRVQHIQPRASNVRADLSTHEQPHNFPVQCSRGANLRQNVVLPNGDVYLCCCDWGLSEKIGNLKTQTFDELEPARQKILERQKRPDEKLLCQKCEFAIPIDDPR